MAQLARAHIGQRVVVTLTESDIISHFLSMDKERRQPVLRTQGQI